MPSALSDARTRTENLRQRIYAYFNRWSICVGLVTWIDWESTIVFIRLHFKPTGKISLSVPSPLQKLTSFRPPSVILNGGYGCFSGTTHLVILAICMHDLASITGMWQLRQVPTTVKKYELIRIIITYSKYFPLSDWLKPHAKFTITSCC